MNAYIDIRNPNGRWEPPTFPCFAFEESHKQLICDSSSVNAEHNVATNLSVHLIYFKLRVFTIIDIPGIMSSINMFLTTTEWLKFPIC